MATEPRLQSWFRAVQQQSESIEIETPAHGDRMNKLILAAPALLATALAFGSPAQAQEPTNPVGFTLSCNIPAGQLTCSGQVSLPAGKRVVLENVSARVHAPSGQTVQLYVSTSFGNLPSGSIAARNYVVLTPTNSGTFYFDKQQLRMYSIIGGHASLQGRRISYTQGAPGSADYEVWFTGYLLP
jgi:hypothetical protein